MHTTCSHKTVGSTFVLVTALKASRQKLWYGYDVNAGFKKVRTRATYELDVQVEPHQK